MSSLEDGGIFYEGTEKMSENTYYYWEAAEYLLKYSQKVGYDEVGVYYYDRDVILLNGRKYTPERYVREAEKVKEEKQERCLSFFEEEQYEQAKVVYAPLYSEDKAGNIFVQYVA